VCVRLPEEMSHGEGVGGGIYRAEGAMAVRLPEEMSHGFVAPWGKEAFSFQTSGCSE
jgi:hypothetical protein